MARKIVLLPVFNEAATLPAVLERLVLSSDAIIAIDDGSRDDSAAILRAWARKNRKVTLIASKTNAGKSKALELGFRKVLKMLDEGLAGPDDAVITMDADGQIPPEIIDEAGRVFAERHLDMLIGERDFRLYPRIKRLGNSLITRLASKLARFPFRDTLCGFRILRAGSLARIMEWYRARRYSCEQEISIIGVMLGLRTANDFAVPTAHYRSNSRWRDAVQITLDSFRAWWRLREARPEAGLRTKSGAVRLAAGAVLLAAAVYLRFVRTPAFATITTSDYSANNLLNGVAKAWPVLVSVVGKLLGAFAAEYLLPVFIFLLPALFLIASGLAGIGKGQRDIFAFLNERRSRVLFLSALFLVALAACLTSHFAVIGSSPPVSDEFCYMFGADELASGKLTVESPPMRDHFQSWSIINDGRWYSKVTVGWPLLLALGRSVNLEFLINPILAAFCVVLLFLIGNSLFGAEAGLLAALWGLATPFFIMLSGTYFPHTATALFSLLFVYLLLRTFEADRWAFPILAGLSMSFLLLIRPADAGVLLLGMTPLMAYQFLRSREKKRAALKIGLIFAVSLAGIGLLMAVNQIQNGDPLLFGYQKYRPDEKWGFGANGHTVLKGLWHTTYSLMRVGAWGAPFVGLFTLISLLTKKWSTRLLVVPVVGFVALYAGYYTLATFEIGPRYYLVMYLLALIPASGGAVLVKDTLARKGVRGSKTFFAALTLSTLLFMGVGMWPRLSASVKQQISGLAEVSTVLDDPPVEPPSVIFLRDHTVLKNNILNRNYWRYQDSRHVFVLYLMPQDNKKVMEMFPSRHVYMTVVDPLTGKLEFVPYVDNAESAANFLAAGLNYAEFDARKAAGAFAKALELAPAEPAIMMNLARAYDIDGDRRNAVKLYAGVIVNGEPSLRDRALFSLATDLRELGEPAEALKVYGELAGTGRDPSYRDRAAAWVEKLTAK